MSVFAEPSITLCGKQHESAYAICVATVNADGTTQHEHIWYPFIDAVQRLSTTFTPCRFLDPFMNQFR